MVFNQAYLNNQILNKCVILEKKQGDSPPESLINRTGYPNTQQSGRFLFCLNNSGESMEIWCDSLRLLPSLK